MRADGTETARWLLNEFTNIEDVSAKHKPTSFRFASESTFLAIVASIWVCSAPAQDSPPLATTLRYGAEPVLPALTDSSAFLSTNWNVGFTLGAGFGISDMGSTEAHHLAVATLHLGKRLESEWLPP